MKALYTLLFAFSIHICSFASPELKPGETSSLINHLKTVNPLWAQVDSEASFFAELTYFQSEAERIEAHFIQAIALLRKTNHPDFDRAKLTLRSELLNTLEQYARAKDFPINTGHQNRIPYFIDSKGTACGVGHLIIESGHDLFAQKINTEMNNAYVKDMPSPEIDNWAWEHGFTVEELALIQPAYPPYTPWSAVLQGVEGEIQVLLTDEINENIIIAGSFTDASGIECMNVVKWNGESFEPLGSNLEGSVETGVIHEGEIFLGGTFGSNADLARWTGQEWELTSVFQGSGSPQITDLHAHDGILYAAGAFVGLAATSYGVRQFNGDTWEIILGAFNAPIHDMTHYGDDLVIGGAFTDFTFEETDFEYLAAWNGETWLPVGGSLAGQVNALAVYYGKLFVGGLIHDDETEAIGLKYKDSDSDAWTSIPIYPNPEEDKEIREIANIDGILYISGNYRYYPQGTGLFGRNLSVLRHYTDVFYLQPLLNNDGPVNAVAEMNGKIYAGGLFAHNGNNQEVDFNNFSMTDQITFVDERESPAFNIYPNPTNSFFKLETDGTEVAGLRVLNMEGKLIASFSNSDLNNRQYDISSISAGTYVVEVNYANEPLPARQKLIIQ